MGTEESAMSVYTDYYNYVVEFEKILKKGVLNGLTVKDRIHFISEKDANSWIDAVSKFDRNATYINFKVKAA